MEVSIQPTWQLVILSGLEKKNRAEAARAFDLLAAEKRREVDAKGIWEPDVCGAHKVVRCAACTDKPGAWWYTRAPGRRTIADERREVEADAAKAWDETGRAGGWTLPTVADDRLAELQARIEKLEARLENSFDAHRHAHNTVVDLENAVARLQRSAEEVEYGPEYGAGKLLVRYQNALKDIANTIGVSSDPDRLMDLPAAAEKRFKPAWFDREAREAFAEELIEGLADHLHGNTLAEVNGYIRSKLTPPKDSPPEPQADEIPDGTLQARIDKAVAENTAAFAEELIAEKKKAEYDAQLPRPYLRSKLAPVTPPKDSPPVPPSDDRPDDAE